MRGKEMRFLFWLLSLVVIHSKEVIELNADTLDKFLGNDLVLIEFYAPWCSACRNFERTYNQVAKTLGPEGFSLGKVNIDESKALASRFKVRHLPTLYLIRDERVYLYDGATTFEGIVTFAQKGYRNSEPIPYWSSPLGPVGSLKGALTRLGILLVNIQPFLMEQLGISQVFSYVLTAFFFGGVLLTLIFIGIYIQVAFDHIKRD